MVMGKGIRNEPLEYMEEIDHFYTLKLFLHFHFMKTHALLLLLSLTTHSQCFYIPPHLPHKLTVSVPGKEFRF